jgi:membrane protein required for colicin V production
MNWLDIVLLVILLVSIMDGVHKGFSREIIGLAAAMLGLLLAVQFYRFAGEPLRPYISQEWLASIAGFLIIFFGVLIVGSIVSSLVRGILSTAGLSTIDRLLGAFYGFARGSLIALAIIVALRAFTSSEAVVQSRMAPYLIQACGLVVRVAPRGIENVFQQEYEKLIAPQNPPNEKK